ncbi:hypothetical protein LINPERHAP1_LOCUS21086 [Linum perenne]
MHDVVSRRRAKRITLDLEKDVLIKLNSKEEGVRLMLIKCAHLSHYCAPKLYNIVKNAHRK